jgi:hypothetical protein|tara:strand:+ start:191 stop:586 length:396 start_codon:yes stop_codon:yes gene_type:complete
MANEVPVEKLVKVYIKMREKQAEMASAFKEQEEALKDKMAKVKGALLEHCKEHNVESVRTAEGVFFRTLKQSYWTNDWESMGKFIVEHQVPELLEKRLHQGNIKQFLAEHPDLLPPGINVDSEYSVTVRRK